MKAVGVIEFGGPEALQVVDLPDPVVGPGEVRIRVHAAAVSPTDTSVRNGARAEMQRATGPPPYIAGMDAAGVLEEIGEDTATHLRVGEHVMAIVVPDGSRGAYSEQIVVPLESVARVPAGSTDAEASTLPMNGLTAQLAIDVLALRPGRTLAVTGAAGAFGGYVVQLGKAAGLTVIADASEGDQRLVKELGADLVLPRGDAFPQAVRDQFPDGVDAAADGALLDAIGRACGSRRWNRGHGEGIQPARRAGRDLPTHKGEGLLEGNGQAGPSAPAGRGWKAFPPRCRDRPQGTGSRSTPPPRGRWHPRPHGDRVLIVGQRHGSLSQDRSWTGVFSGGSPNADQTPLRLTW